MKQSVLFLLKLVSNLYTNSLPLNHFQSFPIAVGLFHTVCKYAACSKHQAEIVKVRLHRTRSNRNVTSSTTCQRLQPVAIFTSGCLTLLRQIVDEYHHHIYLFTKRRHMTRKNLQLPLGLSAKHRNMQFLQNQHTNLQSQSDI